MKKILQQIYLMIKDEADNSLTNFISRKAPLDWKGALSAFHKGSNYFEDIVHDVPDNGSLFSQFIQELLRETGRLIQFGEAETMSGLPEGTLRVYKHRGRLEDESCTKIDGKWYITRTELERILKVRGTEKI